MTTRTVDVAGLLSAGTVAARIERVRQEELADAVGLGALLDAAEQAVHDDPVVALDLAEVCDALAAGSALTAVRARASYLLARVHAERGNLDEALRLIERARDCWTDDGDRLAAMRTDLGRMHVLDDLGRHPEAAEAGAALLAALDDFDGPSDQVELCGRLRATAWNNLGASYCLTGNHERALDAYSSAEAAYDALGLLDDRAQPLANRGIALIALGRPREALDVLCAAAVIFRNAGDRLWEAKCGGVIAQAHQQLGELVDALRVLDDARVTLEALGAHAEITRIRLAAASVYLSAGLFAEARAEALVAREAAERLGLRHDHAVGSFVVALAHLGSDRVGDAEEELRSAGASFAALGDRQYSARVQLASAELAARQGRDDDAGVEAAAAAECLAAGGWRIPEAWARLRASDFAPPDAVAALLAETAVLVDALRLPDLRYAQGLRQARLEARAGEIVPAERSFRAAIAAVELLGANLPDATLAISVRADKLDAHDGLIDLLVARGRPDDLAEALRLSDDVKAKTLLDMITGTVGARSQVATEGERSSGELERRRADLSAVYNAMAAANTPSQLAQLQRQAQSVEDDVATLRIQQRAVSPPAPSADGAHRRATFAEHGDDTKLAYHVVGDDIVVFILGNESVRTHRIVGARPAVRAATTRLLAQWSRFRVASSVTQRRSSGLLVTARHELAALHRLLLAPVLDEIVDRGASQLVVVPHRELHQVPFHALYDGEHYALERWTFSIAPTVGRVAGLATSSPTERDGTLVLAVPDERAPSIALEAQTIAAVMPNSQTLVGPLATADALQANLPGPAFVHLACHGLYRPASPMFSALRLGDRWVTAAEILDLDLSGALVTLSACESGRPGRDTAEPVGLAWAFLAAGATGALVSQWIVDDDTTTSLMADTYAHLAAGHQPAAALRSAQLAVAERQPHPFHWAPFVHVASPTRSIGLPT